MDTYIYKLYIISNYDKVWGEEDELRQEHLTSGPGSLNNKRTHRLFCDPEKSCENIRDFLKVLKQSVTWFKYSVQFWGKYLPYFSHPSHVLGYDQREPL